MATIRKAQNGWMSKKTFENKKFRPTNGAAYTTSHGKKTKFLSEDKNYSLKEKYSDQSNPDKRTSLVERRTLKGFLKNSPKAAGKAKLNEKGHLLKKGGKVSKAKMGPGMMKRGGKISKRSTKTSKKKK